MSATDIIDEINLKFQEGQTVFRGKSISLLLARAFSLRDQENRLIHRHQEDIIRLAEALTKVERLDEACCIVSEREANAVSFIDGQDKVIAELRAKLGRWEIGEIFSIHAANLFEGQRLEIKRVREALKNLLDACEAADNAEELPGDFVDGSLLDAARDALKPAEVS